MTSEEILESTGFTRFDDGLWRAHYVGDGSVDGITELFDVARITDDGGIIIDRKIRLVGNLDFIKIDVKF